MTENKLINRLKAMSSLTWGITGSLLVLILMIAVYASFRKTAEPPTPARKLANVEIITVKSQEYRETLTLPARLEADRVATVSPEFGGTLARWLVAEGMEVVQGQLVAELDTEVIDSSMEEIETSLRSAIKNANLARIGKQGSEVGLDSARKQARLQELALQASKSDLELAQIEFKRINNLVRKKVVDTAKLDQSKNVLSQAEFAVAHAEEALESSALGVRRAELQIKEAQANLELADTRIEEIQAAIASLEVKQVKTHLMAPVSGKLEEHLVEPGEVVAAGAPLAYIYDLRYMRATVNVPDRYIAFLDPDNPAAQAYLQMNMLNAQQHIKAQLIIPGLPKLTGGNGGNITFDTRIARIAQASDPESNTFKVELRLQNPGGALRHGMIARGKIEYLYYPKAIVIPVKAVQVTDEGPRVLIVETDGDVQKVEVKSIDPISVHSDKLLIGKGLSEGDHLIVAGWKGLVSGEEIKVLVKDGRFITPGSGSPAATGNTEN